MRLNKKVIGGLAVVALGVLAFAPNLLGAALPLLFLAACPLSMVFMMRAMSGASGNSNNCQTKAGAGKEVEASAVPSAAASGHDSDAQLRELEEEVNRLRAEANLREGNRS